MARHWSSVGNRSLNVSDCPRCPGRTWGTGFALLGSVRAGRGRRMGPTTVSLLFLLLGAQPLRAQLRPEECVLLFNRDSEASRELAEHYATVRKIPADQRLGLAWPLREAISRDSYDELAAEVRGFLRSCPNGDHVRCLVTFYDVPLKVAGPVPGPEQRQRRQELEALRTNALTQLRRLVDEMQRAATETPIPPRDEPQALELPALLKEYSLYRSRMSAQANLRKGDQRQEAFQKLLPFIERGEGRAAVLALLRPGSDPPTEQAARLREQWGQQVRQAEETLQAIRGEGPMSPRYPEALPLLPVWRGLLGLCRWLDDDIARLSGKDCHAALDSELSLVLWERYDLYRWVPNPIYDARTTGAGSVAPRTLMVGRIDAPTPALARRMIDEALVVEQNGLGGTFYIDLRRARGPDLYGEYDRDLFNLYLLVRQKTDIPVVIDWGPEVFAPGACPDAGLYCGWYNAAHYVPAFEFRPGAVGVHIASFELASLRQPEKRYWCAGLLRDGVAATLGATAEPYLQAFPRPSRFFGLLLTGELTLVECFYRSKPFNSWQLTLLGDPLYRPFAHNPKLELADVEAGVEPRPGWPDADSPHGSTGP
jgi:uncharacterized protein (TIGR03790 family)